MRGERDLPADLEVSGIGVSPVRSFRCYGNKSSILLLIRTNYFFEAFTEVRTSMGPLYSMGEPVDSGSLRLGREGRNPAPRAQLAIR